MGTSQHISQRIDRNPVEVYIFAANVENLPRWASGVGPDMEIRFAKQNYFGILDHWVTVGGQTFYNPMRVIEDGKGSEVVFTLRDGSDEDAATIAADLATLKRILEEGAG